MIFTVIQYLPILEEETPGHRVEMSKKADQDDTSDGSDSGDDDDTENEKTDLFYHAALQYSSRLLTAQRFYIKHASYQHPVETINTPPPKA